MATPEVQFNHPETSIKTIASAVTLLAISLAAVAPAGAQSCSLGAAVGRVALLAGRLPTRRACPHGMIWWFLLGAMLELGMLQHETIAQRT